MIITVKKCKRCMKEKPISEFSMLKGKPKKNGEVKQRPFPYCNECSRLRSKEWYHSNLERGREKNRAAHAANRQRDRDNAKKYRATNKEKVAAYDKAYKSATRPARTAAQNARYELNKRATPRCLSWMDKLRIAELYEIAAAKSIQTGIKHHVDHIFPLRGRGFCGLNVPWNLEVIPAPENVRKWRNVAPKFAHMLWDTA
jgi:hypothetical protein